MNVGESDFLPHIQFEHLSFSFKITSGQDRNESAALMITIISMITTVFAFFAGTEITLLIGP